MNNPNLDAIREIIKNDYIPYLTNKSVTNPKLLIYFLGVPGSGKTTLAKMLEQEFEAIRISKDDIITILRTNFPQLRIPELARLVNSQLEMILTEIARFPNGLVILDKSADRQYQVVQKYAKKNNYQTYIINLDPPRYLVEQRIKKRSPNDYQYWLANMNDWWENHENALQAVHYDFTVKSGDPEEINKLIFKLRTRISNLSTKIETGI